MKGWKDYVVAIEYDSGARSAATVRALSLEDARWRAARRKWPYSFAAGVARIVSVTEVPK